MECRGAARELGRIVEGAWREAHAGKERAAQANDRGHVFHVSLSLHRDEGQLDDATWGQIASDYVDAMGFTSASGKAECQWVGVRHCVNGGGNDLDSAPGFGKPSKGALTAPTKTSAVRPNP